MKFKLGLAIGFAVGYWYGSTPDEERRRQVDGTLDKVRNDPRVQRLSDTVSRKTTELSDAVDRRAAGGHDRGNGSSAPSAAGASAAAGTTAAGTTVASGPPEGSKAGKLPGTGVG